MVLWRKGSTERPSPLPGSHLSVNPTLLEEIIGNHREWFTKAPEGSKNHVLRLGKSELLFGGVDRGIDIGVFELLQPQQSRFQAEIFLRQRIMTLNRLHHRFNRLRRD